MCLNFKKPDKYHGNKQRKEVNSYSDIFTKGKQHIRNILFPINR